MQVMHRGQRFVIIDDFLDDAALAEIRSLLTRAAFSEVDSVVYPDSDGKAYRSKGMALSGTVESMTGAGRPKAYEKILNLAATEPEIFGAAQDEWDRAGFTFWQYPAGSRLSWHNDIGGGRQGEFIIFLHDTWQASWGGELMILDEDPAPSAEGGGSFIAQMERQVRTSENCPVAILPTPNRLVLVKAGTAHQINRVDPTAGSRRCTLTGFLSKKPKSAAAEARDALLRLASEPDEGNGP